MATNKQIIETDSSAAAAVAQAVATASQSAATTATMGRDIDYIKKNIDEIKNSIQSINNEFVARREFEERFKAHEQVITEMKANIVELKNNGKVSRVVTPIMSAITASIFTFLLISYLTKAGG